jgi:hypothetical protein
MSAGFYGVTINSDSFNSRQPKFSELQIFRAEVPPELWNLVKPSSAFVRHAA